MPDIQGHTVCDSTYVKRPKQAYPQTGRGLVVARGWGGGWGVIADGDSVSFFFFLGQFFFWG